MLSQMPPRAVAATGERRLAVFQFRRPFHVAAARLLHSRADDDHPARNGVATKECPPAGDRKRDRATRSRRERRSVSRRIVQQDDSSLARLVRMALQHLRAPRSETIEVMETKARHELAVLERGLIVLGNHHRHRAFARSDWSCLGTGARLLGARPQLRRIEHSSRSRRASPKL